MNPPRVFISYSHDSAEHKQWVLDFATTLCNRGVEAVLDQWELKPGDDVPHFMETQLAAAEFVLMICSERYVEKANEGAGGVGYEKMIITSKLLSKIDSNKIIPIIRQTGSAFRPTFLKTKLYIDFSNDKDSEFQLDVLIRVLLNAPLYEKPEIGKNPFQPMQGSRPDRSADGLKEAMKIVAGCFHKTDRHFVLYARIVEQTTMHRLILDKYIYQAVDEELIRWHTDKALAMTPKGIAYLESHEIIEG